LILILPFVGACYCAFLQKAIFQQVAIFHKKRSLPVLVYWTSLKGIFKNLFLIIEFYTEAGMGGRLRP
jgi:hypothetical protein